MNNGSPENFKEWWQTRPKWQKGLMIGSLVFSVIFIIGGFIALSALDSAFAF